MKYGLWENGKRIKWFTQEQVNYINEGILDYSEFFELARSKTEIPKVSGFEPPANFEKLAEMTYKEFPEIN